MEPVTETHLPFPKRQGKVRDVYDLDDRVLIVTTDRISAFDRVLSPGIPHKGVVLHKLTEYWWDLLGVPNHCFTTSLKDMEKYTFLGDVVQEHRDVLKDRTVLAHKFKVLPVEFIIRGFLAGSAWKDYKETGAVCGIELPAGLKKNCPLPEPIITPSTKADEGHDRNISVEEAEDLIEMYAGGIFRELKDLYRHAAAHAFSRGVIIADTKTEWSKSPRGYPILVDELLTPDSSRFWGVTEYTVDRDIPSFDKQYVRDWLERTDWDKNSEPPILPPDVVETTSNKYLKAFRTLTGKNLNEVI